MDEDQEQKHACKLCKKYFPCGRSLGGHMRSHMRNTTTPSEKLQKKKSSSSSINGGSRTTTTNTNNSYWMDFDGGGHVGYGLRENPKKTWRLSDSIDDSFKQDKLCKECGKGFQSWKALFGHMRCHSDKERVCGSLEDDSWIEASHKLIMDTQSETETETAAPRKRKRSRRTRYKNTTTVTTTTTTTTTTTSSSFCLANNASSSVSEIEQEQEEVAMCLMMLSRDVGYWGGLNSLVESSDNNSVVAEVRSSSLVKENCNVDHNVKVKKPKEKKLKCAVLNSEKAQFESKQSEFNNSNFGVSRNEFNKLEVEVSVGGSIELGKSLYTQNRLNCSEVELGKTDNQIDSECDKYDSSKRARHDTSDSKDELWKKTNCKTMDSPSKSKYECTACNKAFHSYQALGGHRASHKRTRGCFAAKTDGSETSIDQVDQVDASPDPNTDIKLIKSRDIDNPTEKQGVSSILMKKKHECPICFKVFASGQALGGHKRSHVLESSEARGTQAIVIQQQLPEIRDLLDLNLPAPVEEEGNVGIEFRPWWIGNSHKHEQQAVGLIIN